MAHPKLWGTTDTRNGFPTTTKESPDFSHGECQLQEDWGVFCNWALSLPHFSELTGIQGE